uniref:C-type lectin domain-containing protein n=2 Tax=Caenorhabditis japonica TaxID=281687 RepID=A0A8R1IP26_CAEJA
MLRELCEMLNLHGKTEKRLPILLSGRRVRKALRRRKIRHTVNEPKPSIGVKQGHTLGVSTIRICLFYRVIIAVHVPEIVGGCRRVNLRNCRSDGHLFIVYIAATYPVGELWVKVDEFFAGGAGGGDFRDDQGPDRANRIASNIKESGHTIITVAFVEPGSSDMVIQIGELASPRMNFTSFKHESLVNELEDALCQVNCYCPNGWGQLILEHRKYGECFFPTKLDASWTASKYECPLISQEHTGNGHLVYVNSELKNEFLNQFYMENWAPENQETPNYDIGYAYDKTSKKYVWVNGVTNNPYTNWAEKQPNIGEGDCVQAVQEKDTDFKWYSIDCATRSGRGLCQEAACDSDFYCPPEVD